MGYNWDRWTALKLFEVAITIACLVYKRVTDDEASRLFLYLQKISREWSLLNNVTWDRVGAAVADATYGGYVIITIALFVGRLVKELPTQKRIIEFILLGVGALLFIILGSLEFAALDSVPYELVDNAAVLGTLSLVTAALFLLDMGGPKAKRMTQQSQTPPRSVSKPTMLEARSIPQQVYDIERDIEKSDVFEKPYSKNGHLTSATAAASPKSTHGGRYKDASRQYGKYDILSPSYLSSKHHQPEKQERAPSGPGDPGYVQYTAQHWGESVQKTPRHSPTQV